MLFDPDDFYYVVAVIWVPSFLVCFFLDLLFSIRVNSKTVTWKFVTSILALLLLLGFGLVAILIKSWGYDVWPFTFDRIRLEFAPAIGLAMAYVTSPLITWISKCLGFEGQNK